MKAIKKKLSFQSVHLWYFSQIDHLRLLHHAYIARKSKMWQPQSLKAVIIFSMVVFLCQMFLAYWIYYILCIKSLMLYFAFFIPTKSSLCTYYRTGTQRFIKILCLIFLLEWYDSWVNWPWNILRSDEVHFCLNRQVNTQNCQIWEGKIPHFIQEQLLYLRKKRQFGIIFGPPLAHLFLKR